MSKSGTRKAREGGAEQPGRPISPDEMHLSDTVGQFDAPKDVFPRAPYARPNYKLSTLARPQHPSVDVVTCGGVKASRKAGAGRLMKRSYVNTQDRELGIAFHDLDALEYCRPSHVLARMCIRDDLHPEGDRLSDVDRSGSTLTRWISQRAASDQGLAWF